MSAEIDDSFSISIEDDLLGSSVSFTLGENSVHIKEKPKILAPAPEKKEEQWWLKKPSTQVANLSPKNVELSMTSPDMNPSAKEFVNKEHLFKNGEDFVGKDRDKDDDTLDDLIDSAALNKYESDFEGVTDEDIGSLLDEMSKIANAMSPIPESAKSKSSSNILTEEECSAKELLLEADKLMKENDKNNLKKIQASMENKNDAKKNELMGEKKSRKLDLDLGEIANRDKDGKKNASLLNGLDHFHSNVKKTTETKDKVGESGTTDLNSDVETSKLIIEEDKENMQKEIEDIEKEFLDVLVKKSQEKIQELSTPSSFDEKDFANFLKILKNQDKDENLILSNTYDVPKKSPETPGRNSRPSSKDSKKSLISPRSANVDIRRVENAKGELFTIGLTPRLELFADTIPKLIAEKSNEKNNSDKDISPRSNDSEDFCFKNLKSLDAVKSLKELKDHTNVSEVNDYNLTDLLEEENDNEKPQGALDLMNLQESIKIDKLIKSSRDDSKTDHIFTEKKNMPKSKSFDQMPRRPTRLISPLDGAKTFQKEFKRPTTLVTSKKSPSPKTKLPPRTVFAKYQPKPKVMSKSKSKEFLKSSNENLDYRNSQMSKSHDYGFKPNLARGESIDTAMDGSLEYLYEQERYKCLCMQKKLESEVDAYKGKIKDIQMQYDQEMFSLKKENILLNARLNEWMQKEREENKAQVEEKMKIMQKEISKLENVVATYEAENKKLLQDNKHLQSEVKKNTQKPKIVMADPNNPQQELLESVKDLREKIVNLNLEIRTLKEKNAEYALKYDDSTQQNDLLQEELEMIKDQLEAKNEFITDRLHVMTTNELQLRKKVDDMQVDINTKVENLKLLKLEYDKLQQAVVPVQKEILHLRSKCGSLEQKLQSTLHEVEKEKQHNEKLKEQVVIENKTIVDLNRQIKEMEKILKRKNPDSVSALILTANSDNEKFNCEKVRLLEERIVCLENENKANEDLAQEKLRELQRKFEIMREKYAYQISNSGDKILLTNSEKRCSMVDSTTQTFSMELRPEINGNDKEEKKVVKNVSRVVQNSKEDAHLIATIRGLKLEMANKDRSLTKLKQECQELQKTNRRLQREREKLLNDKKNFKENEKLCRHMSGSDSKLSNLKSGENGEKAHTFYQNGLGHSKKISASAQKLYDPSQFSEDSAGNKLKKLSNENEVLKQELSKFNKELVALKNKRLQDLNILQEEHEREIASIVKEYSCKAGDSKALKLQGQVNSQSAIISHLKEQIEKLQDYKEQVFMLKTERERLEEKVRMLNEKFKYLATPSSQQLQLLQGKISMLQQRHENRELSLQKLVRDLLRSKTQCKDCKGEKGKQLCYFRQELDNIIGMLQELTNI